METKEFLLKIIKHLEGQIEDYIFSPLLMTDTEGNYCVGVVEKGKEGVQSLKFILKLENKKKFTKEEDFFMPVKETNETNKFSQNSMIFKIPVGNLTAEEALKFAKELKGNKKKIFDEKDPSVLIHVGRILAFCEDKKLNPADFVELVEKLVRGTMGSDADLDFWDSVGNVITERK